MILSLTTHSHMIQLNFNFLRRTNKKYKNVHPTHKCPMKEKKHAHCTSNIHVCHLHAFM